MSFRGSLGDRSVRAAGTTRTISPSNAAPPRGDPSSRGLLRDDGCRRRRPSSPDRAGTVASRRSPLSPTLSPGYRGEGSSGSQKVPNGTFGRAHAPPRRVRTCKTNPMALRRAESRPPRNAPRKTKPMAHSGAYARVRVASGPQNGTFGHARASGIVTRGAVHRNAPKCTAMHPNAPAPSQLAKLNPPRGVRRSQRCFSVAGEGFRAEKPCLLRRHANWRRDCGSGCRRNRSGRGSCALRSSPRMCLSDNGASESPRTSDGARAPSCRAR